MAKQTFTTGQVLTAAQMTSLQQTAMGGGSTTAKTTSYVLVAADAGTVVAMNAAGSTTITVNTGLFSAGDTVFIQNWGAGVCTVTAGTATVTTHGSLALSQWEGGTLYFTSASAAIFFDISQTSGMTNPMTTTGDIIYSSSGSTPARLGIGSTGQVLTVAGGVPSWATPAGTPTNPAFRAYRNTSVQTLTVNTITKVQLNGEDYDTANCFDSTTNYRFTPNVAGYYQFNGKVYFDNTGTSHRFFAYLYKNGSNYATFDLTNGNPYGSVGGSELIYLNGSTDYVELYAQTSSTTTRTIYFGSDVTSLSGVWIRS